MTTIVNEELVSFKELEKKIYSYVCELGREITQQMLETYDKELAENRDKKLYRGKGKRATTIKTIYGEVTYSRNVYRTETEEGQTAHVFLLDEAMHMDKIGLISTNLAEKIALTVTESPYRVTAEQISSTCGQSISAGGVWNMMQRLGERIDEEELHAVKQMNADQSEGEKEIPVLFEEMDGVWLNFQDAHHKKMKKQEMKVFTMYEGWDEEKEKQKRTTLVGKTMLAGMEPASARLCFEMIIFITIVKPICWVPSFIPPYGLRAAGDVKFSMIVSCCTMWLCRVSLCIYLCRVWGFGPIAVWIGMACDWMLRSIIFTARFHSRKWLNHHVID